MTRLAVAASVAAALALGAGAVYQGTSGDRRLADSYRSVLAQGHGSFFAAAPLWSRAGTLGSVFGYQGQPSWLFATLNQPTAQPEQAAQLHPDVAPQVSHLAHAPERTSVSWPHSEHGSPS